MPTVPSWIPRAVVILPRKPYRGTRVVPVKEWRATTTQVVVTLDNEQRTEIRFYLDGLRPVGATHKRADLVNPADPEALTEIRRIRATEAVDELKTEMAVNRLSELEGEDLLRVVTVIRDAADEAMQRLAEAQ